MENNKVKIKKSGKGLKVTLGLIIAVTLVVIVGGIVCSRNSLEGKWTVVDSGIFRDGSDSENLYSQTYSNIFTKGTQVEFTKDEIIILGDSSKYSYKDKKLRVTSQNGESVLDAFFDKKGELVLQLSNFQVVLEKLDKSDSK